MMMVVLVVLVGFFVGCNIYIATTMTTEEMKRDLYYGQCFAGKIFANILYSLAWIMKIFYRDSFIEKRRAKRALERCIKSSIAEHENGNIKIFRNYVTGNIDINFFSTFDRFDIIIFNKLFMIFMFNFNERFNNWWFINLEMFIPFISWFIIGSNIFNFDKLR